MYACNSFFTSQHIWVWGVGTEWLASPRTFPYGWRIRLADVHAQQATDERGNETGRLLAQLFRLRLMADADPHNGEQEREEDSHGPDEDEDRKHRLPAPSATT
jgi:hypothetical protein